MTKISFSEPLYFSSIEERIRIKVNPRTGERVDPNVPKADPTETATSNPDPESTQPIVLDPAVEIAKKAAADKAKAYTVKASEIPATTSAVATATTPPPQTAPMASGGTKPPAVSPPATAPSAKPAWQMSQGKVKLNQGSKLRIKDIKQVSPNPNVDPKTGRPKGMPPPNPAFPKETEPEQIDVIQKGYAEREKEVKVNAQNIKASQKAIERHQRKEEKKKIAYDRAFKRAETEAERAKTKGTKQAWKGLDRDANVAAKAAAEVEANLSDEEKQAKATKEQEAEMWAAHKASQAKSVEAEKGKVWKSKTAKEQEAERIKSAREMGHQAAEVAQQKSKARAEKRAMVDNPNLVPPPPVDPADIAADLSAYGKDKAAKDAAQKKRVFDRVVGVEKERLQGILAKTRQREKQVKRAVKFGRHATRGIGKILGRTVRLGQNVAAQVSHPSTVSFNFRNN